MVRNLVVLYAAQIVTSILSLVPITFLPVYLGDTGMGKLTFALSFTGVCGTLMVMGTATYIVREIARDPARIGEIIANGVVLRAVLALGVLPVAAAFLYILGYAPETRVVVLIMYGSLALRVVSFTFAAALQALEDMTWRSAATVTREVVAVALGWLVLSRGGGIIGYVIILAIADIAEFAVNLSYFLLIMPFRPVLRIRGVTRIFWGGIPFFLWAFLQTIYMQTSSLMLSKLGGEQAVGWFGTSAQFIAPLLALPSVAITVLLPRLSQLHVLEPGQFRSAVARSTNYMTLVMMPIAFGLWAIADRLIELFGYPATFRHSIPVLQILAFSLPATALLMTTSTAVSAMDKERAWAKISFVSLIAIVALNGLLIPLTRTHLGNAALGAAAADLLAELLTLALTLRLIGRAMLAPTIFVTMAKATLAAAVMGGIVRAAPSIPLPLAIMLGGLIYTAGVLLTRAIPADDLVTLRAMAERRAKRGYVGLRGLFGTER